MKPKMVPGPDDYPELGPSDKVPKKGLAMRGAIVYEDGREIGLATSTPANAAVQHVIDQRGNYVEIRYLPARVALQGTA